MIAGIVPTLSLVDFQAGKCIYSAKEKRLNCLINKELELGA